MSKSKRTYKIHNFIIKNIEDHPKDIVSLCANEFGISRQSASKHVKSLVDSKILDAKGNTRSRVYSLHKTNHVEVYDLEKDNVTEDVVWDSFVSEFFQGLDENVFDIWHYGVTEMVNNVIDHSSAKIFYVQVMQTALDSQVVIGDNGEGIFKKIQRELKLSDERHSALELSKGKFTTDPENHSGEGVFFSSRVFDHFLIMSGKVSFSHHCGSDNLDWINRDSKNIIPSKVGTFVHMKIANNSNRVLQEVFDKFSPGDEFGFIKTVVPVRMAEYGSDKLVSRSQAKRVLVGLDKFKVVMFDFNQVESVGQAFADEIFRVFAKGNIDIEIVPINANEQVSGMIKRALVKS